MVVVALARNNALAGDYAEACEELIDALRMADNTQLQATTKKQIFTFLDNEVCVAVPLPVV